MTNIGRDERHGIRQCPDSSKLHLITWMDYLEKTYQASYLYIYTHVCIYI